MAPEHDVVYAKASVVHRPGCPRADGQVEALAVAGEVLWREYAPATCWHCRPWAKTRCARLRGMGERRATAIAMTVTDVQQPGPRLVVRLTDGERTWTWETELVPHRITGVTQLMDSAGLRWPTDSELDVLAHEHAGVVLAPEYTRQLVGRKVGALLDEGDRLLGFVDPSKVDALRAAERRFPE